MGVSRSHLSQSSRLPAKPRTAYQKPQDAPLIKRIRAVVDGLPTYGYRRVTAVLNRREPSAQVNHKRVYRVMKAAKLLLAKYAPKPRRPHEGKVITLKSNMRWCSDGFEIRCWNSERVHVAFALDCCDREAIAYVAADRHLAGEDIRDVMALCVERRFGGTRTPHPVEWLSDNGPPYTAEATRAFGRNSGLIVCNTAAYSPESNGMAEAFVKTFKRDYAYVQDLSDAATVLHQLPSWFEHYNEHHPHKGLKMKTPRQFRRQMIVTNCAV